MSVKIISRVWEHSSQKATELLALLALADFADDHGVCWPGLDRIAQKVRVDSIRYVRRIVRKLEEKGEVFTLPQSGQSGGRGYTNLYLVASGMSAYEIEKALVERFEVAPELAARIADYLITLQNGGSFEGEKPDDPRLELQVPNKGGLQTPQKKSVKKGGLQGPKGGPTGTKRGAYRDQKGGLQTPRIRQEPSMNPSMNPSESAAPQNSKRLKAKKGKQNAGSIPVAIKLYQDIARRFPPKGLWPKITETIGESPPGLALWQEIVTAWIGCGWKPTNVAGMLEYFERQEIPSTSGKRAGKNPPAAQPALKGLDPANPEDWRKMLDAVA